MGKLNTEREEVVEVYETDDGHVALRINNSKHPIVLTEEEWLTLVDLLDRRGDR